MNVFDTGLMIFDKKRILLVEDEALLTDLYKNFLEKNGAEVSIVVNGHESLELMNKEHFDLVILDRILNDDMSGFDVLAKMRESEKTKDTPVIVLSNLNLERNEEEFVGKCNISGYYVKADVSMDVLSGIIDGVVNKS